MLVCHALHIFSIEMMFVKCVICVYYLLRVYFKDCVDKVPGPKYPGVEREEWVRSRAEISQIAYDMYSIYALINTG